MMEYKGYRAVVSYDAAAGVLQGEVAGTRDVIVFEGKSVEELHREFQVSIDDYLAVCAERGREPDKAYSGKVPLRLSPELHRAAALAARAEGKSLNAWLAAAVERAAKTVA